MNNLKKAIVSLMLAGGVILSIGAFSTANAQDWRRDRNRDGIPDRYETRRGRPDFNRNGIPDQYERNRLYEIDRNRNGVDDRYEYNRYGYGNRSNGNGGYYGNNGYYGNGGYGYNNYDVQQGYRDGLDRGREDALSGRYPTPKDSQHFRNGNAAYREGFSRGYNVGFRQARAGW